MRSTPIFGLRPQHDKTTSAQHVSTVLHRLSFQTLTYACPFSRASYLIIVFYITRVHVQHPHSKRNLIHFISHAPVFIPLALQLLMTAMYKCTRLPLTAPSEVSMVMETPPPGRSFHKGGVGSSCTPSEAMPLPFTDRSAAFRSSPHT